MISYSDFTLIFPEPSLHKKFPSSHYANISKIDDDIIMQLATMLTAKDGICGIFVVHQTPATVQRDASQVKWRYVNVLLHTVKNKIRLHV